jgi:tyrosyl-tRNA synthetase
MSFAEFTYPLLQAWDWWELFKKGTQVQIGGADQFGNILAGVNAIKAMKKIEPVHFESDGTFQGHVGHSFIASQDPAPRVGGNINEPIGFTVPLLTTSAGVKFGKSAGNAIWLDKELTSTFDLYQFFLRSSDADVERYLKLFTFLSIPDIEDIMQEHRLDESRRVAQHKLAVEFVELIHGLAAAQEAERQHKTLFSKDVSIESLRADTSCTEAKAAHVPGDWSNSLNKYALPISAVNSSSVHLKLPRSLVVNTSFARILWSAGLVGSNSEGHRLIAKKGCHVGSKSGRKGDHSQMSDYLSFVPITTTRPEETEKYIVDENLLILRVGKWKMKIITILSDKEYEETGLTCPGWKEEKNAGRENQKEKKQELVAYRTERNRERLQRQQPGEPSFSDWSNE